MVYRFVFIIATFIISALTLNAENIDSLIQAGKENSNNGNIIKGERLFRKAINLAKESDKNPSRAMFYLGRCLYGQGEFKEAKRLYDSALKYANSKKGKELILIEQGNLYHAQLKIKKAIEIYEKVKESYATSTEKIAILDMNIGLCYLELYNFESTLSQLDLALPNLDKNDSLNMEKIYYNYAITYLNIDKLDKAEENLNKSFLWANDKVNLGFNFNLMGLIYLENNKPEMALENFLKALKYHEMNNNQSCIAETNFNRAKIYVEKNPAIAIPLLKSSISYFSRQNINNRLEESCKLLSKAYLYTERLDSASVYYDKYITYITNNKDIENTSIANFLQERKKSQSKLKTATVIILLLILSAGIGVFFAIKYRKKNAKLRDINIELSKLIDVLQNKVEMTKTNFSIFINSIASKLQKLPESDERNELLKQIDQENYDKKELINDIKDFINKN